MILYKMTIGTYTFYTTEELFAIEIFGFLKYFFEFIVNFDLFLFIFTKFLNFKAVKSSLLMLLTLTSKTAKKYTFKGIRLFILTVKSFIRLCKNRKLDKTTNYCLVKNIIALIHKKAVIFL